MAEYTLVHPAWDNVTRVADGAEERDRYQAAGWLLKEAPKAAAKTTAAKKSEASEAPVEPTGASAEAPLTTGSEN